MDESRQVEAQMDGGPQQGQDRTDRPDLLEDGNGEAVQIGDIAIFPEKFEVLVNREPVHLTLTEFRLLLLLARRSGWTYSPEQIREALSSKARQTREVAVKTHVYTLRRKLGEAKDHLETVRGLGYRLNPHPRDRQPED